MLVYILDPMTLDKIDIIEDYESLVWTERFQEAGEVQITVGATKANASRLRPGALLLHQDSNEPMLTETRDIKQGVLTATGKTIEAFFNERFVGPLGHQGSAKNILRYVVDNMQTRQSGRYAIPNLRPQDYDSDTSIYHDYENILSPEPGYDAVLRLAKKYSLGIGVIRQRNISGDLELVFVVRDTTDRTQPDENYLRLSPDDDNFAGIDELYSLQDWVDVVLVHPPKYFWDEGTAFGWPPMSHPDKADHGGPNDFALTADDNPFDWRITEIFTDDIDQKFIDDRITDFWSVNGYPSTWAAMSFTQQEEIIRAEMQFKAKEEWHNRKAKQKVVFDGEIPGEIVKYGRDYHLGDLIVVEGSFSGAKQTSMISEYIRSADGSGARSYPTLSAPLEGYDPASAAAGPGWGGSGV